MTKDHASEARDEVIKMKLKLAKTAAKSAKVSRRKAKRNSSWGYHGFASKHLAAAQESESEAIRRYAEVVQLHELNEQMSVSSIVDF